MAQSEKSVLQEAKYTMTISRLTVDKLGVKLYDKVSAVLAELVSNSYDADARKVVIKAPMGEFLATKNNNQIQDRSYTIEVSDNGIGMTPDEINKFYLRVGAERRADPLRGDESKGLKRKVMGRKGVGKLAPFGICERIEILTSGGQLIDGKDESGVSKKGYLTAHLILDRTQILQDTEFAYAPQVGNLDEIVRAKTGTNLKLTIFSKRKVPDIDLLSRQLAQRFGISSSDWEINLIDSNKTKTDPDFSRKICAFDVDKMENTEIRFNLNKQAVIADGTVLSDIQAGFDFEGKFYPVTGWAAYAKDPYKDDLMAGIRIYCRGKIAAQTSVFNRGASFSGEYSIRSYLIGELHANWLDEQDEDLIQTDRRDILWSHELGQAFEQWGLILLRKIGNISRNPVQKKTWDVFRDISEIERKIEESFPANAQKTIRDEALGFAKLIGQSMRREEASDPQRAEEIVQLSLLFGPHISLDHKLREAAEAKDSPVEVLNEILKYARVAELSSFGRIADERVRVIKTVETLKDDQSTLEEAFQNLIEQAPWLINPQWSPITANQTLSTLKSEFQKYYKLKTGEDIQLVDFSESNKRPDFVMSSQDSIIQIIEIKKPHHTFADIEMVRLQKYADQMSNFLDDPAHREFKTTYHNFHITLVCDTENLNGIAKGAFSKLVDDKKLTFIDWATFLLRTRKMHQAFLDEADRQKKNAATTI
jgi:Histidine kinase-, DNA gyrase B-, and HSP90-like ATPase